MDNEQSGEVLEATWQSIFKPAPLTLVPGMKAKKCRCGNGNCKRAKRILCTCSCHSANHGSANRVGMEPLDKTLGLEKFHLVPWLEVC